MTGKSKNRGKDLEDFLRYSQDQMSEEERYAFERFLQKDPFAAEALEGFSAMTPEEARADLARLREKLHRRTIQHTMTIRKTRAMWYRIAASVAVLLVITTVLFNMFHDRIQQLDRKVAESPETGKEEPAAITPLQKIPAEHSDRIKPVQSGAVDEEAGTPEKKESIQVKSEEAVTITEIKTEIFKEEQARKELADIQVEEAADALEAELAEVGEVHAGQAAAPAMAMEKQAAAKSRKRETPEQMQMADAVGGEHKMLAGVIISSEDGQPIPGAFLALKGSNTGAVTDMEGRFQIPVGDDSIYTLIAQFIGMEPREIPVKDENDLMIVLEPDAVSLEEVVVIGTGSRKIAKPAGYTVKVAAGAEGHEEKTYPGATPVGGKKEFSQYVINNLRFPEDEDVLKRAVVVLSFMVGYDGRPTQVIVLKSPGKAFSDEAIRLLMDGPDWQPAGEDGIQMEPSTLIQIVFKKEGP